MEAISLLGMAGSGKSTIGKILAEKLGFAYISTGDIARQLEIDKSWEKAGNLAPEEIMRDAFVDKINRCMKDDFDGIIIDGMPRIPDQVNFLCSIFDKLGFIEIDVPIDVAKDRLYSRNRSDDKFEAIEKRLNTFNNNICGIESRIYDMIHIGKVGFSRVYSGVGDVNTIVQCILNDIIEEEEIKWEKI